MGKKVVIITMHKVVNFGSALQAWALQETIRKIGHESFLIDYLYPNKYYYDNVPKSNVVRESLFQRLKYKSIIVSIKKKYLYKTVSQKNLFKEFWNKHFLLTNSYDSIEALKNDPPSADVYMTGSDQVWNPKTMYGDPAFFLDFGSDAVPRISYAASFGTNIIPDEYKDSYVYFLSKYKRLGIREKSGVDVVNCLINKNSTLVCDPTLLLTKNDYSVLAKDSTLTITRPYLLAYILDYAYNPFPVIETIIQKISKKLGLHVVYLLCGNVHGFKMGSTTISAAGPNEFIHLFRNASFVVTSSFHGTVFSLLHEKDFYSVVSSQKSDSRIASLLSSLGIMDRAIRSNENFILNEAIQLTIDYASVTPKLDELRSQSLKFLKSSLENI